MVTLLRLVFVCAFVVLLAVPGMLTFHRVAAGDEAARSSVENRRYARFSQIPNRLRNNPDFIHGLPSWVETAFSDQMPIRHDVTRIVNSTLVYGFGRATGAGVSIHRGHWFLTETPSFTHMACAAPAGINEAYANLLLEAYSGFNTRMAARGVDVYLILPPTQATINPSRLPPYLRDRCEDQPPPATRLVERLRDAGARVAYDVDWFRETGAEHLFEPRSYHWHFGGGMRYSEYLLAEGMLSELGIEPMPVAREGEPNFTHRIDLANRMGVGWTQYRFFRPPFGERFRGTSNGVQWRDETGDDYARFVNNGSLEQALFTQGRPGTGRALIIGDSFSRQANFYLARHFEEALVLRTNFMGQALAPGSMEALVEMYQPDHILFIFVETKFAPVDPQDSQAIMSSFLPEGTRYRASDWQVIREGSRRRR